MKNAFFIVITLMATLPCFSQFNPEAQKYLDDLANAVLSAPALEICFEGKITNQSGEESENGNGTLFLSKHLSRLDIDGSQIYSDGKTQWVYLTEEQEVTIQPIEANEITPASIFTIYKEGYRFILIKEEIDQVIIELLPDIKTSDYVRITLNINTKKQQLNGFVAQGRDGMLTTVTMTKWEEKEISENALKYIEAEHPDVEVIDLR